jgi:hypothetical protein
LWLAGAAAVPLYPQAAPRAWGGSGIQQANAAVSDSQGNTWIVGYTDASNFPTVNAPFSPGGGVDAFIVKLDPSGNVLLSTYFGGAGDDRATAVGLDAAGNVYIAGTTTSSSMEGVPLAGSAADSDGFVVKLDPTAHSIFYAVAIGGSLDDLIHGMAVGSDGAVWVAGETESPDLPVTSGALQKALKGSDNAFVAQLTPGGALGYCTYLGGSAADIAYGIAVDTTAAAWVVGSTTSPDFPLQSPLESALPGSQDSFVARLAANGGSLLFSTYFGGSGAGPGLIEYATSVAVDASGNAYVAGVTSSSNFPVLNAYQSTFLGWNSDAFLSGFTTGGVLRFSTYLGGSAFDMATAVALMPDGRILLTGYTLSSDFPVTTTATAWHSGGYNGFFAAFDPLAANLLYATYLNQGINDAVYAIAAAASPVAAGVTTPANQPGVTLADAFPITLPAWSCQLNPQQADLPGTAATGSVTVTASAGFPWTAVSNAAWLTIQSGNSGTGNGTVNYSVTANPNVDWRGAALTIGGQTFLVTQAAAAPSGSGNSRSFISNLGSDANNCTVTANCLSLARALAATKPGGEIVVLNSGEYGPATISQPVIISAIDVVASITATSGNALTIDTTGNVTITGLGLHGLGSGNDGALVEQVGVLRLYNVTAENFANDGIEFDATGMLAVYNSRLTDNHYGLAVLNGAAEAFLHHTSLDHNSVAGVWAPFGVAAVSDSSAHYNGAGFDSGGGTLVVARSRAALNGTGLQASGAAANLSFSYCSATQNTLSAYNVGSGGSASGTNPGTTAITGHNTGPLSDSVVLVLK